MADGYLMAMYKLIRQGALQSEPVWFLLDGQIVAGNIIPLAEEVRRFEEKRTPESVGDRIASELNTKDLMNKVSQDDILEGPIFIALADAYVLSSFGHATFSAGCRVDPAAVRAWGFGALPSNVLPG